jgi:NAD-dependent SIR2 family protein deacetylase
MTGSNGARSLRHDLQRAADYLKRAGQLVILAGAGVSADSELPTFRGEEGFWRNTGKRPFQLAGYEQFQQDPAAVWAFYLSRLAQYRSHQPHEGYELLQQWCHRLGEGNSFVFTSNTDGYFRRAGFADNQLYECHGTIGWMYCDRPDCVFRSQGPVPIHQNRLERQDPTRIPRCACGALMRPHVLMFGDRSFDHRLQAPALARWEHFKQQLGVDNSPYVVLEIGAGDTVTVVEDETWALSRNALAVIQINPEKPKPQEVYCPWVGIKSGALHSLQALNILIGD